MTEHPSQQAALQGLHRPAGRWRAFLAAAILLLYPALARTAGISEAVLDGGTLKETHDPEVEVSGNIVVGVMAAGAYTGLARNRLVIRPPISNQPDLCLKVTSRDGAYSSENHYRLKDSPAPVVLLTYVSKYPAVVSRYTSEQGDIAIAATRGSCAQTMHGDYYLPADRNAGNTPAQQGVTLYINGFDATDVYYQLQAGEDWQDPEDCDYIEEGRHTAYNFSCEIAALPDDTDSPLTLSILREVYGRELQPVTIKLFTTR